LKARLITIGRFKSGAEGALFTQYNARLRPPLDLTELAEATGSPAEARRREASAFGAHDEGEGIAMGAAAEAMETVVIDVEGGGFLIVKGAEPFPVPPGFREPHAPPDEPRHGRARTKLVEEIGRERHGSSYCWGLGPFGPSGFQGSALTLSYGRQARW